jgi:hypothetical protein
MPARRLSHVADPPPSSSSSSTTAPPAGATVRRAFQAETQKLLHIVANSLYSEKEVWGASTPHPPGRSSDS